MAPLVVTRTTLLLSGSGTSASILAGVGGPRLAAAAGSAVVAGIALIVVAVWLFILILTVSGGSRGGLLLLLVPTAIAALGIFLTTRHSYLFTIDRVLVAEYTELMLHDGQGYVISLSERPSLVTRPPATLTLENGRLLGEALVRPNGDATFRNCESAVERPPSAGAIDLMSLHPGDGLCLSKLGRHSDERGMGIIQVTAVNAREAAITFDLLLRS